MVADTTIIYLHCNKSSSVADSKENIMEKTIKQTRVKYGFVSYCLLWSPVQNDAFWQSACQCKRTLCNLAFKIYLIEN